MPFLLAVRDRPFTPDELERMRLLLSVFRDGSGQFLSKLKTYMPDFLAFERATAIVCGGETTENKGIFDVLVPGGDGQAPVGISCKMATAQPQDRSWFMELSNSAKKFHDAFGKAGIEWMREPARAGEVLVSLVESWHHAVEATVDVSKSKYLILAHDTAWKKFQIVCLDLNLRRADVADIEWAVEGRDRNRPSSVAGYVYLGDRRHRLWQFYANSGGQLKYYPPIFWAEWVTDLFELETPPVTTLREKVDAYWPGAWPE